MKNARLFSILLVLLISAASCRKEEGCVEENFNCKTDPSKINLRVENQSSYTYHNITLNVNGEVLNWGNLKPGEASCYSAFDKAYYIAHIEFEVGGKVYSYNPDCLTGEEILANGKYTYKVDLDVNCGCVDMRAQKD